MNKILRPLFNFSYNKGLACGQDAGKWLFKNRKFEVIHNGKDIEKFRFDESIRNEIRRKYDIEDKMVIGFVGRLNKQKNVEFLLDIFENFQKKQEKTALFFIGDGELKDCLEEKCKKNKIKNVIFTGSVSNVNELLQ